MKATRTSAIGSTIENNFHIYSDIKLTAEWNMNRYVTPNVDTYTNNGPLESFPAESVIETHRPTKSGVIRAFVENAFLYAGSNVPDARYYPVSKDDVYKYWITHNSQTNAVSGVYRFSGPPAVIITYASAVKTNKITILVENKFNNVVESKVEIKTSVNGSWTTVSTNPTVSNTGMITIYKNFGSWSQIPNDYMDSDILIYGIRFTVNAVSKGGLPAGIIEVSPRLEKNLTQYVITTSTDEEVSDVSFVSPIGAASSNQSSVTLSNTDNIFNNDNTASPFYGIIDRNVKMTSEIGIKTANGFEYVRQFTMFTDSWTGQKTEEVQVSLNDSSSAMQSIFVPKVILFEQTIGQIIAILCDITGFTNYNYELDSLDLNQVVQYYWTDGEQTLWDCISKLAEGTQTAAYFDSYNILQIKSRSAAFSNTTPDWVANYKKVGNKLPDIISYSEDNELEANSVDVIYTPTQVSELNNGTPKMEVAWEPEDTLTLRAAPLRLTISNSDKGFVIPEDKAAYWPYEGLVNIDSEIIKFKGKSYHYNPSRGVTKSQMVYSKEEKDNLDALTPADMLYKNRFSGNVGIAERGVYNTQINDHSNGILPYNSFEGFITEDGVASPWNWQGGISVADSAMTLTTNYTFKETNNYAVRAGNGISLGPGQTCHYGTRIKFKEGVSPTDKGEAGIFFSTDPNDFVGYWVSIRTTDAVEATKRYRNEVSIWGRLADKWTTTFDHQPAEILRGVWYDVDVTQTITQTGAHAISVLINGVQVASVVLTGTQRVTTSWAQNRHGIQVGNHTAAEFEYYYASTWAPDSFDSSTFYDRVKGGYSSGFVQRNWYNYAFYDDDGRKVSDYYAGPSSGIFFDDFGSYVHEVREFDVKFEFPVLYSKPYFSNERVDCPKYVGHPFGATFTLVNAGRSDAILKGEDLITFGAENSVTQQSFIYGRKIYQEDPETINVKNDAMIRRRGEIKTEFNSQWLQNKPTAQALSEWVVKQWAGGIKYASLELFGNPLIEVGDVIEVNYEPKSIVNKKFFVVAVETQYDAGISTSLTLHSVNS